MRILVTGGAGYIGSQVAHRLDQRGDDVFVLDSLRTGHPTAVGNLPLVIGDIGDRDLVSHLCRDEHIDAVVHLAGSKSVAESLVAPEQYFANNVVNTLALLDGMAGAGVRAFVFSSSAAVYGIPERLPVDEASPTHPTTPYGESKLMIERALHWLSNADKLRHVSLRYFNAAGASLDGSSGEDWTAATNLVPVVMKVASGQIPVLRVFGNDYPTPDGTAVRDYIHVLDLAEAHACAVDYLRDGGTSQVLNVGTGVGWSVQQVLEETRRIAGRPLPAEYVERRSGDPPAIWADSSRATMVFGWRATLGITEIIDSAWRWHSIHPEGHSDLARGDLRDGISPDGPRRSSVR